MIGRQYLIFFRNHTHLSPDFVNQHTWKFLGFKAESKLEIAFEGLPHSYRAPHYMVYKYQRSEGFTAYFEVEVRTVKRYIPPGTEYDAVEIERTDYLPTYGISEPDRGNFSYRVSIRPEGSEETGIGKQPRK